ncbi:MAG: cell division protein ZapC [Paraglaciecola sp.]|jgi:cell division protein ZapC
MLQPKTDWYWYTQQHTLCISLGDEFEFTTAFNLDKLVNTPHKSRLFSLADSECYLHLADKLEESSIALSDAQTTQLLLNACAALAFHKPMSPKSWYFEVQDNFGVYKKLALLESKFGEGLVLVLEQEYSTVTCMLISAGLQLNETKSLKQFQLIKVMADRLVPYIAKTSILKTA